MYSSARGPALFRLALGLAAGLALAATARADDSTDASVDNAKDSQQDQIEDLRATLGEMSAKLNSIQSAAKGMIEIHGFEETDIFNDTTGSFEGSNPEVVGNAAVKLFVPGANYLNDNGATQGSIRNSRIDFLAQKEINGWKTKGYIEFDLLGYDPAPLYGAATATGNAAPSPSEAAFFTNPTLRVRHAYLDAQKSGWDFMAGQYWTLLGWNMDYQLATVSVAPVMGVLYQRTPQVRVGYTFFRDDLFNIQTAVDAERPSEREADMLNYSQGVRFLFNGWNGLFTPATSGNKTMPLSVGISGTEREFKWDGSTTLGNYSYDTWGHAIAADGLLPIIPSDGKDSFSLVVTGEFSAGTGYGDEFPSWSGGASALTAATGNPDLDQGLGMLDKANGVAGKDFTLVEDESWNAQVQFHLPPSIGTIFTVGYGQIDSPNVSDLLSYGNGGTYGKVYNLDSATFVNAMQDLGPIRVAVEYDTFLTHYAGNAATQDGQSARDNRLQLSTWYRF